MNETEHDLFAAAGLYSQRSPPGRSPGRVGNKICIAGTEHENERCEASCTKKESGWCKGETRQRGTCDRGLEDEG